MLKNNQTIKVYIKHFTALWVIIIGSVEIMAKF